LYTGSKDIIILLSTAASRYYNYCRDGSISPGNYAYPLLNIIHLINIGFEVLTAVVINAAFFWDIGSVVLCETEFSMEYITSVFRVENQPSNKPACSRWLGGILTLHITVMETLYFRSHSDGEFFSLQVS
jgi:hypothetical protein